MLRVALLVGFCLFSFGSSARAEDPDPSHIGKWELRCFTGIGGGGERSCHIDLRVGELGKPSARADMGITISTRFDERITVVTYGLDNATCEYAEIKEQLYRGYNPINSAPTEKIMTRLQDRVIAAVRSHLRILAVCDAGEPAPFPVSVFDATELDLRKSIAAVESGWTQVRHLTNPIAKARETGSQGNQSPVQE